MSFVKNLIGGVVIIAIASLIGVVQNSARSKPVTLFPKTKRLAGKAPATTEPSPAVQTAARPTQAPAAGSATKTGEGRNVPTEDATDTGVDEALAGPLTADEYAGAELGKKRLRALLDAGSIVLLDARSEHEYAEGHLPGAINIPYDSFVEYYSDLESLVPLDADVVTYCRSVTCDLSDNLAQELQLAGYERVLVYRGGWQEWTEAGYPVEGTE